MEKQIEEMSKVIEQAFDKCYYMGCDPIEDVTAETLYNAGYRKASDVAREIFEEIEKLLDNYHLACLPVGMIEPYVCYDSGLGDAIAELKKKYESEGTE